TEAKEIGFVSTVVAEQVAGASVGSHENVEIAVIVEVAEGRAASDVGFGEGASCLRRNFAELLVPQIAEQVGRLSISDLALNFVDVVFHVSVRDEDVGQAVEVVIEEETTEGQGQQALVADLRGRPLIDKERIPLIV